MNTKQALEIIGCKRATLHSAVKSKKIRVDGYSGGRLIYNDIDVASYAKKYKQTKQSQSVEHQLSQCVSRILSLLGKDVTQEGLKDTPMRVARMFKEMLTSKEFNFTSFSKPKDVDQMIISGPIAFESLCEHHLLPFFGEAWVGYIPKDKIVGLSKIARLVDAKSKDLNTQETMTAEIARAMNDALDCQGVAVVLKATHLCQKMRGAKSDSIMTTSAVLGAFTGESTRSEFMKLAGI